MMSGVITAALVSSLSACSGDRPPKPADKNCDDWEWDNDTGTYYCDDHDSSYRGHYFYGGSYYSNKNALKTSPNYKSYSSQYKSGIGSGFKGGFGG